MGHTTHDLILSKRALDDFCLEPNKTKRAVKIKLRAVRDMMDQLTDFVPWPALYDSFAEDAKKLQRIYDRMT